MSYLIDTDIIIYSLKGNELVNHNFQKNKYEPIYISAITVGELIYGAEKSKNREKNLAKVAHVKKCFKTLEINSEVMETFGRLKANQEKTGEVVADMDLQIASVALYYNLILVTNNVKHFSKIKELKIENWNS